MTSMAIRGAMMFCKLVAADAKSVVRGAQRPFQGGGSGAQNIIAPRMAMLVIHFLEAVQIQHDETQWLTIAPRAIEFLLECFGEEPSIVEIGEGVGDGVELEFFQVFILDEDRNTKKSQASEDIQE